MPFLNLPYYDILIVLNFYQDALQSRREELIQSNEAINENYLFFTIVGGKRKSTIYGLGSQASEYYMPNVASTSTTSPSPKHNVDEIQDLRKKITQQEEVINDMGILTGRLLQCVDEMSRA